MADLLRSVTIERGHDPREFVMFAGGGQGPSHAWALCRELGIRTFVVTPTATGAVRVWHRDERHPTARRSAPVTCGSRREQRSTDDGLGPHRRWAGRSRVDARAGWPATAENMAIQEVTIERTMALRYRGQAHHLDVPRARSAIDGASSKRRCARFEEQYESLFGAGSAFREAGFEVLSVRVLLTAHLGGDGLPGPDRTHSSRREPAPSSSTIPTVPVDCPVWHTEFPAEGQDVRGPALVVYPGQTLVVPPGAAARTDELGNFVVRFDDAGSVLNDGDE